MIILQFDNSDLMDTQVTRCTRVGILLEHCTTENDLFENEIQSNLPENWQISSFFRTLKSKKCLFSIYRRIQLKIQICIEIHSKWYINRFQIIVQIHARIIHNRITVSELTRSYCQWLEAITSEFGSNRFRAIA